MKNVFVLPTDKPSRLYLSDYGKELNLSGYPLRNYTTGQHIYITSDEEIKEYDYFLNTFNNAVLTNLNIINSKHLKKIILTTDGDLIKNDVQAIDDEFLNWFVKNPSCEEVYIRIFCCGQIDGKCNPQCFRKSYEIIIPKEEPKQDFYKTGDFHKNCDDGCKYHCTKGNTQLAECLKEPKQETLEEAALKIAQMLGTKDSFEYVKMSFKLGAKCQQEQDRNKFSEEDLREAYMVGKHGGTTQTYYEFKEWFEQYKNKL
jgi:hypothetical protein